MEKSAKTRLAALESLRLGFSSRVLYEFLLERRFTISDCLERSLRKGGGEEQAAAATVCALLCMQLGGGVEGEEGFKMLRPILSSILIDSCASLSARQSCARALGMCCYVHLPHLHACLESSEVNFRIAVGETIALLYELGRDIDQEFEYEDCNALCDSLKSLATDGNKHRAKNDRRKQRSIFREVLHYIENEDFTEEKIQFGIEVIYIDGWMRRKIYDAFKEVLESGVRHHLQFNPLLRDIFGLGPPLILDASVKASRISRTERHLFNSAAFKARTKLRNKVRDKRADVM
uniref:Interferon-related developmental regulator 2-like n=1 Tax=Sinocyclocheilus anshuiensis TaxID=1608454 RepID=A0A671PH93_9TELE